MKDDFIRKQYDDEIERQHKIVASLSLPITILTGLGTAAAAMIQGFSYSMRDVTMAFGLVVLVNIGAFISALWFLRKAMFGQTYEYLPRPIVLKNYFDGLVAYYVGQGRADEEARQLAGEEFQEYLAGKMIKAGTKNAINNDEKSDARYYANWAIWGALIITGVMVIPYAVDRKYRSPEVPTVHVANLDSIRRELQNGNLNTGVATAPGPTATSAGPAGQADTPREQGREGGRGGDSEGSGNRGAASARGGGSIVSEEKPAPAPPQKPEPPEM